jgi:hypothetical protein
MPLGKQRPLDGVLNRLDADGYGKTTDGVGDSVDNAG